MANQITPFAGSVERALMALLIREAGPAVTEEVVGGDLAYDPEVSPLYIRIDKVTGQADRFEGDFVVDVEVFGADYLQTESVALAVEAIVLGYPHRVEVDGSLWVFDKTSQNVAPHELPWEDDRVSRLGATYVLTARRR